MYDFLVAFNRDHLRMPTLAEVTAGIGCSHATTCNTMITLSGLGWIARNYQKRSHEYFLLGDDGNVLANGHADQNADG